MQDFSLHTHTIGFDGRNTAKEMVACASKLGLHAIGISNHFIVHPRIKESKMYAAACAKGHAYSDIYSASFDEVMARFVPHYAEMERLATTVGIRVLRGMEVDWFDDATWQAEFAKAIKILKPDYLIGAKHFVEMDGALYNPHDMANADSNTQHRLLGIYWDSVAKAASSGLFNWMAHLDLPKKVGLGLGDKWAMPENTALDTIAASGTGIEINVSGFGRCGEPYPSTRILRAAAARKIAIIISDDAHAAEQIGLNFDAADTFARSVAGLRFVNLDEILNIR